MKCKYCNKTMATSLTNSVDHHRDCLWDMAQAARAEGWRVVDGVVMKPCPFSAHPLKYKLIERGEHVANGGCDCNGTGLIPAGTAEKAEEQDNA